jgi:hypothetical protein
MAELESAILLLSHGSPDQISAANKFLMAFIETDDAWRPALELVSVSQNDYVCSFASNLVYTKLRKHWNKLNQPQRQEVFGILSEKLKQLALKPSVNNKMVVNRIALALLCMCTRTPNGLKAFATQAASFFTSPEYVYPSAKLVALDMMSSIPSEVDQLDVTREMRLELDSNVLELLPGIMEMLNSCVAQHQHASDPVGQAIKLGILGAIESWITKGVTADTLYADYRQLFEFALREFTAGDASCVKKASLVVQGVMAHKMHPPSAQRNEVVMWTVQAILRAAPSFSRYFGADGDDDVAIEICNCVVSIVAAELPMLMRPEYFQMPLFELLLTFMCQKPRKIAALTFEVWCNIEDTPACDRHVFMRGDVYSKVFEVLMNQCIYTNDDLDDTDDINTFRDSKQVIMHVLLLQV